MTTPTDETVAPQPTMDRAAIAKAGFHDVLHHIQEIPGRRAAGHNPAAAQVSAATTDRSAGADQWPTNLLANAATATEPGAAPAVDLLNSAAERAARTESCRSAFDLVARAAEMALLKEPVAGARPATRPAGEPVPVGAALVVSGPEDAEQLFARLLAIMKTEHLLNAAAMPTRIVPPLGIFSCDGPSRQVTKQDNAITITTRRTRRAGYVGTASVATPRSGTTARTGTAATADRPRPGHTCAALTGTTGTGDPPRPARAGLAVSGRVEAGDGRRPAGGDVARIGFTGAGTHSQPSRAGDALTGPAGVSDRSLPTRVAAALAGSNWAGESAWPGIEVGRAGNLTPAQADRAAHAEGLRGGGRRSRRAERPAWRELLRGAGGDPQSGQTG